jgi:predicted Rossmann-fold nucleotide-binding protein
LILNTSGFYDHLIAFLNKAEEVGFLYSDIHQYLRIISSPEDLEFFLTQQEALTEEKQ